tara:strand:+ start:266 stop:412 length:147 start_codon:yes stop_codon:yes gene_type:complete
MQFILIEKHFFSPKGKKVKIRKGSIKEEKNPQRLYAKHFFFLKYGENT